MEHATDYIADLKRHFNSSPELAKYLTDLTQNMPVGSDGVPKLPGLSPDQTRQWLTRLAMTDAAMQDAAKRGPEVAERATAEGTSRNFAGNLETLKSLPAELVDLTTPKKTVNGMTTPPTGEALAKSASQKLWPHDDIEKNVAKYDRAMASPNDAEKMRAGVEATAAFRKNEAGRDPRITFGMSQMLSPQEQKDHCALEDRFKAVDRVNKFLDYGQDEAQRRSERSAMDRAYGAALETAPRQMEDFYASTHYGVRGDGFEQKAKVLGDAKVIDQRLSAIQQRDGIANDGSFKLPMMTQDQSKEWLARCERMDSALEQAKAKGLSKLTNSASQSMDQVKADMARMVAMPQALAAIEKGNLSPDRQRAEVDKLMAQYGQIDKNTQDFEKGLASKRGIADRMSDAWDRMKDSARSLNPFRSSSSSEKAAAPAQPVVMSQGQIPADTAPAKSAAPSMPAPAQTIAAQTITAQSQGDHLTVSSGEVGHEMTKGAGFAAMGKVDDVKHVGNTVVVDYSIRGQHFDVKIEEKDAATRAMGHAAEELKPGDAFKMSIGKDRDGREVAQVEDRTTGHAVQIDRSGRVDEKTQAPEHTRARETGR